MTADAKPTAPLVKEAQAVQREKLVAHIEAALAELTALDGATVHEADFPDTRGKRPFREEAAFDRAAPGAKSKTDFPFDEIYRHLDGEDGEDGEDSNRPDREMSKDDLIAALRLIFVWMTRAKAQDQRAIKSIGIKAVAATWVMNPALFGNAPAHMVARSFGVSGMIFKTRAAEFSREFKFKNRMQLQKI